MYKQNSKETGEKEKTSTPRHDIKLSEKHNLQTDW